MTTQNVATVTPKRKSAIASIAALAMLLTAALAFMLPGTANASSGTEVRAAASSDTYDILKRGALLVEWGSGYEDVQTIQGGWLKMEGTTGHGEIEVRNGVGQMVTHTITDAYPAMGGLGLELEVRSDGLFPQVVTFSTVAAGSPLYQGPDGGYEGDLEDWAGINEMEVFSLSFQQAS